MNYIEQKTELFKRALAIAIIKCKVHNWDLLCLNFVYYNFDLAVFQMSVYDEKLDEYFDIDIDLEVK